MFDSASVQMLRHINKKQFLSH